MARLNRESFLAGADDLAGAARDNVVRDGFAQPHIVGLTAKAEQVLLVGMSSNDLDSPVAAKYRERGFVPFPMPFHDHAAELVTLFSERGCVAAIYIDEAWVVRDHGALDVMVRGMRPSEHASREEVVLTVAVWPREFVTRSWVSPIQRDAAGTATGVGDVEVSTDGGPWTEVTTWLSGALPQAPGRGSDR